MIAENAGLIPSRCWTPVGVGVLAVPVLGTVVDAIRTPLRVSFDPLFGILRVGFLTLVLISGMTLTITRFLLLLRVRVLMAFFWVLRDIVGEHV